MRCIDPKDKQNFESVATLVSSNVLKSLEDCKKDMRTQGTIFYLKMMRNVRDAILNKSLPTIRVYLKWKTIFILRIWRTWLEENGYHENEHFITPNAYTCIEINGHLMVNIALKVASGMLPPESLRFWKTGSQSCEQMFRLLRSMTPTFSKIINFTLKGMLDRVHKITFMAAMEASGEIDFPRAKRRLLQLKEESDIMLQAPSATEVYTNCFMEAKNDAISECRQCSMEISSYDDNYLLKEKLRLTDIATFEDGEIEFDVTAIDTTDPEIDNETENEIRSITLVKTPSSFPTYIASEKIPAKNRDG